MSDLNLPIELAERLSPLGQRLAADIIAAEAREDRVVVTRREAARMLGVKTTRVIKLEQTGALRSYLEGVSRKITAASVYAYTLARIIASHPIVGEAAKRPTPMRRGRAAKRRLTKRAHERGATINVVRAPAE
jgi:hypothetical protein